MDALTKPTGALGRLEDAVVRLAGALDKERPRIRPAAALVFAADHEVAAAGVSAYPQAVTRAMLDAFEGGHAAASVLARSLDVPLTVWDVGVLPGPDRSVGAIVRRTPLSGRPSRDPRVEDALGDAALEEALTIGARAVAECVSLDAETRVFVLGEVGIGNTTLAACVASALLDVPPERVVGRGSGVDDTTLARKREVVSLAVARLGETRADPWRTLAAVGGAEIAAMAGAALEVGARGGIVLVDGVVATAAMIAACAFDRSLADRLIFGHRSGDAAHDVMLERLGTQPLLDLGMRVGEGTGALVAFGVLDLAVALHREMRTFEEAAVPNRGCR